MTLEKGDEVRVYDWNEGIWLTTIFIRKTKTKYILAHPGTGWDAPFFDIDNVETISYSKKEMKKRIIDGETKYYFKD